MALPTGEWAPSDVYLDEQTPNFGITSVDVHMH